MGENTRRCAQHGCEATATERFDWPGAGWCLACSSCALRAVHVADAMGFPLTVEPLEHDLSGLAPLAAAFVATLQGDTGPLQKLVYLKARELTQELCDQEGGVISPELGHVPGKCTYNRGHHGPHSWEPFEG